MEEDNTQMEARARELESEVEKEASEIGELLDVLTAIKEQIENANITLLPSAFKQRAKFDGLSESQRDRTMSGQRLYQTLNYLGTIQENINTALYYIDEAIDEYTCD